jgi:hypothetical protein
VHCNRVTEMRVFWQMIKPSNLLLEDPDGFSKRYFQNGSLTYWKPLKLFFAQLQVESKTGHLIFVLGLELLHLALLAALLRPVLLLLRRTWNRRPDFPANPGSMFWSLHIFGDFLQFAAIKNYAMIILFLPERLLLIKNGLFFYQNVSKIVTLAPPKNFF